MTWEQLPNPQSGEITYHEGTHPFLGWVIIKCIQRGMIHWPFIPQRSRLWLLNRSFVWFGYKQWEGGWRLWDFENWGKDRRESHLRGLEQEAVE
jgi:hypothetical protein